MLRTVTVLLCLSVSATSAAQVFKCIHNGKVTYSEAPCPGAQVTQLELQPPVSSLVAPPDAAAELQRQKALADKLASERHVREAQYERESERASRQMSQRYQHCEKLRLDKKWADEGVRNARDGEQAASLRKRAARAAELLKLECPG